MNDIIIHISDLHITDSRGIFGQVNQHTFLKTNSEDINNSLIDSLCNKINEIQSRNKYLVITGDIVDIAEKCEFLEAHKVLSRLINTLQIPKNNILIVPGDHEVHRRSILNELEQVVDKEGFELADIKFKNFREFYKNLLNKEFDFNKVICNSLEIDDIIILGMNSNSKVGQHSHDGFISSTEFHKEMTDLKSSLEDKHVLLAVHHNMSGTYQDSRTGQWDKENRKNLIPYFQNHNIKMILHGNEHTPKSETIGNPEIYVSDSGAMAGKNPKGSIKVYEIVRKEQSISLLNNVIELRSINALTEPNVGEWIRHNITGLKTELNSFDIYKDSPNPIGESETHELPSLEDELPYNLTTHTSSEEKQVPIKYQNIEVQDRLYNIIKDKSLFHSGHYHWSESSRAHNWIDVAKLLENSEDLYFVKNAIVELIKEFNLQDNCDLLIGLGVEGNIISTKASIYYNIPQISLPYSYRYDESHEFEKNINYDNSKEKYRNVIIITDVVNDGRTLRKLIGEAESKFFSKVDKIIVISLFYTGHEDLNLDILNFNKLPAYLTKEDDYKINNIEYYTLNSLRVEKCPYGKEYKTECLIYKDDLSCVHLFYEE